MSTALLETLNSTGTGGRILRKTMTSAVQNSYETSKATARLAALESRNPQSSVQMEQLDDAKLRVRFEKGVQGRGHYEEIVDSIPAQVLKEVVGAILKSNPEGLRPQNLAQLSPRVLWALAHGHWKLQQERQQQQDAPSPWEPFSAESAYRQILPDGDWSFLRRRKQTLSAKAVENLRQEQEDEGKEEGDYEKAAEAIQQVENAMECLQHHDRAQKAERVAKAAMARQQRLLRQGSSDWKIITPSELDEDELIECISSAIPPQWESQDNTDHLITQLAKGLVEWLCIRNWRELSEHQPVDLHARILEHDKSLNTVVTQEHVEQWVMYARDESVQEIIVEICDGSVSHVELLREKARSGTPRDLAAWKEMPDLLLEELGEGASDMLALADLTLFCDRATCALQQFEWLTWFATPVE